MTSNNESQPPTVLDGRPGQHSPQEKMTMALSQRKVLLVCGNLSVPVVLENPEYARKRTTPPSLSPPSAAQLQNEGPIPVSILGFTSLQAVACYPVNHDRDSGISSITYMRPAMETEIDRDDAASVVKRTYSVMSGLVAAMVGCEYVGVATFGLSDKPAVLLWPVRVVDGTDGCSDICLECRFVDVEQDYPGIGKLTELALLPFHTISPFSSIEDSEIDFQGFCSFSDHYRNGEESKAVYMSGTPEALEVAWKELQQAGDRLPKQTRDFVEQAERIIDIAETYEIEGMKDCLMSLVESLANRLRDKRDQLHSKPGSKRKSTSTYSMTKSTQKEDASLVSALQSLEDIRIQVYNGPAT
eukprot:gb/GECG01002014.1/.p1 GENE.gb/GECG01002014.1/~~gb/GECG01002014.1/.p1  ORF type:complete len:357 (+),score=45.38 gb/GECG01002014.1/:1-1071(+)